MTTAVAMATVHHRTQVEVLTQVQVAQTQVLDVLDGVMTSFDIVMKALGEMTKENSASFTEGMRKVGGVFDGIKADCTEEQLEQLSEKLESASGCVNGLSEGIDKSGYLGMDDDELFAMFFFQKILEQVT